MGWGTLEARRAALFFGLSALTLALGVWLKIRCLDHPLGAGYEFRNLCYSDTLFHWGQYGYNRAGFGPGEVIPYVNRWNEYPVLTGLASWTLGLLTDDFTTWWRLHAITLFASGMVVTWVTYRLGFTWKESIPWIAAPTLVISGFTNYDLWAMGLMMLGFLFHQRGKPWLSGLFLGLGAAAKVFPGVLWPVFALVLINRARLEGAHLRAWSTYKQASKVAGGFLLGAVPINLVFMLRNYDVWAQTWRFQSERFTTYETVHYFLDQKIVQPYLGTAMSAAQMNLLALVLFLALSLLLLGLAFRKRSTDAGLLAMGILCAYLLSTKVYSTQHSLWILPLFVLGRLPLASWVAFEVADVVAFHWFYEFFTPPQGSLEGRSFEFIPLIEFWVAVRLAVIATIIALVVWRLRSTPAPTPLAADVPPPIPVPDGNEPASEPGTPAV